MSKTIGETIRKLRKELNYTQEELAEQLNVSGQSVSKWENGTSMPDISQVVPLATVLGVSTDVLFDFSGKSDTDAINEIIKQASALRRDLCVYNYALCIMNYALTKALSFCIFSAVGSGRCPNANLSFILSYFV